MYFLFQLSQEHRDAGAAARDKWRQSTACNHPHHGHNSGVVPVGPRRRGEPEADNKVTQAVNPNQTRRKYSCLKCYCQNFYKIKEKKGPTHSPGPPAPKNKFYTQNFTPKIHTNIQKHSNIHPHPQETIPHRQTDKLSPSHIVNRPIARETIRTTSENFTTKQQK